MDTAIPTADLDQLKALPIVQAGKTLWQNSYHPHDVYDHTEEVVRILRHMGAQGELIAAGWLHDVGKPLTKVPKVVDGIQLYHPQNGRPYHSFPGHEKKGEEMVRALPADLFNKLSLSQDRVASLVGAHFLPMARVKAAKKDPTFEAFCAQLSQLSAELDRTAMRAEVLTLFYADKASQRAKDLEFLLALKDFLDARNGDEEQLFTLFLAAYGYSTTLTGGR